MRLALGSSLRYASLWALAVLALAAGCAPKALVYRDPDFHGKSPDRVAVLPFANESPDMRAGEALRRLVASRMPRRGYPGMPLEEIDDRLNEIGVTHGGQLAAYSAEEVGKALGIDGLLYGIVEEFANQNIGVVRRRAVKLRLKLVLAPGGERIWEAVGAGVKAKVALEKGEIGKSFLKGVVEQAAEGALRVPLLPESRKAVTQALRKLPRR